MSSINRKPHCLIREKTLTIPRHVIFFDTETTSTKLSNGSVEQRLKLGWACYYRKAYGRHVEKVEWHSFTDSLSFWQFVYLHTEKKRKLWVISHSLVFDFTIVDGWKYLRQVGFKLKFFHNQGVTSIISVRGRFGSIVFIDNMNWFLESVAQIGERIGIPKLVIDFETASDEYLSIYCKRDVEVLLENFKLFVRFLEDNLVSRLCYTRGSTAMAAYLFGHYKEKIYIHNNKEAIDLERDSYKGGRVECFYLGELNDGKYYILDVNSMYPFVMRNNTYPVKYKKQGAKISLEALRNSLENRACVAEVYVDTDEPVYAVKKARTIFPIGRFWATLCTPELKYAFERGHILKVGKYVLYNQANIFTSFVDRFYTIRQGFRMTGQTVYEQFCKYLMNSLYGKFGQRADVWKKVGECPGEPDRVEILFVSDLNKTRQIRYLLGEVFELVGYEECFNSFPAIASHVTAYGRMYLWELIQTAGIGNYFYCDTDSLIVNEVGLCNLQNRIDSVILGGLKIEETTQTLTLRGLKDY